jgi:hypothetical protein
MTTMVTTMVMTREKQLNILTDLLNEKRAELDLLIAANHKLYKKLINEKDLDVSSITQKREKIAQNLTRIERSIEDILKLNNGFKEHLRTDKISHIASEIGERASILFESFDKVLDLLNLKKVGINENLKQIKVSTIPARSYLGNSY